MKARLLPILVSSATLLLAACQPRPEGVAALIGTVVIGPEYSASRGLFVPDDTRRSLGLEIVEVDEQPIAAWESLSLFIYGTSPDGRLLASGAPSAAQAEVLEAGQSLQVADPGDPGGPPLHGEIVAVGPAEPAAGARPEVVVGLPRAAGLRTGSFVTASVRLDSAGPVTTVPRSALVRASDGHFVYTVSGEYFVRTMVDVGAIADEVVEVTGGLYSGDLVVTEPAMSLWLTELAAIKGGHACCAVPGEAL